VYSLLRGSPGGFSGATLLVAADAATGKPAWERPVEEAAMAIVGEASGVLFVCNSSGLVLGFDARTGDKLFRTKVGAITRVAALADGSLTLFDESGAIHRARVVRR
jgi:outer membrane protein assembly factor BamB